MGLAGRRHPRQSGGIYSLGDDAAVHLMVHGPTPGTLDESIELRPSDLRTFNSDLFEIVGQETHRQEDGTGSGALVYRGRTGSEYCTTFRQLIFVLSKD